MNLQAHEAQTSAFTHPTDAITLTLKPVSSHIICGVVTVEGNFARKILAQTIKVYKEHIQPIGLDVVPEAYIEHNFKKEITNDLKGFVFEYLVLDFLTNVIIEHDLPFAGYPRLIKVVIDDDYRMQYFFDLSIASKIEMREWKHFLFRAPKRKNYKDLDKQVETFLKRAQEKTRKQATDTVQENDWVLFDAHILDQGKKPLFDHCGHQLWVRIKTDIITHPLYPLFLNKKIGDSFETNNLFLHEFADPSIGDHHHFLITIKAITKGDFFVLDLFKTAFKLTNKTEVHEKLIEVFSYRNELSQRRTIIEEMFHLLFSKHRFEVPKHLILRKQEELLFSIKRRPDYNAYRSSKHFMQNVGLLAEKLLKEEILVDQIANLEKIAIDTRDLQQYLNLLSDSRLKEFIYFRSFLDSDAPTVPIHHCLLKQICRREKTLNYILHQLTR